MYRALLKLWHVFKLAWVERMVYRVNFVMTIISGIVSWLILVFLWLAIYRSAGKEVIGGYSIGDGDLSPRRRIDQYFYLTTAENPETSQNIQDGTLSHL
jgi:hypothetical protein